MCTWFRAGLLTLLTSGVFLHGLVEASHSAKSNQGGAGFDRHGRNKKGVVVDPTKKGVNPKGPLHPTGKDGKSLVRNDLCCKVTCKPSWTRCGGCCGGWRRRPPCYGWWGSWCGGGWSPTVIVEQVIVEVPVVVGGPGGEPGPGANVDANELPVQTKRFLQLKNESGEKLTVYVQYRVGSENGKAVWLPGQPGSDKAVVVTMEEGQTLLVEDNGNKLAAGRVRIWAVSAKGRFLQFRNEDLWLVPEQDQQGQHVYLAPEMKTFTFVFSAEMLTGS